jgi:hypothetical protein
MISQARALTLGHRSVIVRPSRISLQFVMDPALVALRHPSSTPILGASADFQKLNGPTLKALFDRSLAWTGCSR